MATSDPEFQKLISTTKYQVVIGTQGTVKMNGFVRQKWALFVPTDTKDIEITPLICGRLHNHPEALVKWLIEILAPELGACFTRAVTKTNSFELFTNIGPTTVTEKEKKFSYIHSIKINPNPLTNWVHLLENIIGTTTNEVIGIQQALAQGFDRFVGTQFDRFPRWTLDENLFPNSFGGTIIDELIKRRNEVRITSRSLQLIRAARIVKQGVRNYSADARRLRMEKTFRRF